MINYDIEKVNPKYYGFEAKSIYLRKRGVIGSKITPYFENEYNIFKYDYSLGHDFTDVQIVEKYLRKILVMD